MNGSTQMNEQLNEQRRRVRRSALLFTLVAVGVYLSFIVYAVTRGLHGH
jgi:predicted nucleic acid-binding Zn ribbon protein